MTPRRCQRSFRLVAALAALGSVSCSGLVSRSRAPEGTKFERMGGFASVEAEFERTDRRSGAKSELLQFTEKVGLDTEGTIYHGRLMTFAVAAAVGLTQERRLEPHRADDWDPIFEYDASLDFFPKHLVPFSLFARRQEDFSVAQDQFLRSRTEERGAEARARLGAYSARARVIEQETEFHGLEVDRSERRRALDVSLQHALAKRTRSDLDVQLEKFEESPLDREYETREITFENDFTPLEGADQKTLRFHTFARHWTRTGTEDVRRSSYSETVRWEIDEDLTSHTGYDRSIQDSGSKVVTNTLTQTLTHRLYDSLTSTLEGERVWDDLEEGSIERFRGAAGVGYQKRTFFGSIGLDAGLGLERETNDLKGSNPQIVGEPHVLLTGTTTRLRENGVIHSTVVVRDAVTAHLYVPVADYSLVRRGHRTELDRVPSGLIPDGSAVLVDYEIERDPDSKREHRSRIFGQTVQISDWLRLYSTQLATDEEILRGDPTLLEERTDTLVYGIALDYDGFHAGFERENERSNYSPFREKRFVASYERPLDERSSAAVGFGYTSSEFEPDQHRTRNFSAQYSRAFTNRLRLSVRPLYRVQTGSDQPDDEQLDLVARVDYSYGQIVFSLLLDHRNWKANSSEATDTKITFSVERTW